MASVAANGCRAKRWKRPKHSRVTHSRTNERDEVAVAMTDDVPTRIVGTYVDYDALISSFRDRIEFLELKCARVDEIAGIANGVTGKMLGASQVKTLGLRNLFPLAESLGLRCAVQLYLDDALVAEMQPLWEKRQSSQVRINPPSRIGQATIQRMMPTIAAEMGRRGGGNPCLANACYASKIGRKGGRATMAKLTAEARSRLAKAAAAARWTKRGVK
jgi:hypothetical protein